MEQFHDLCAMNLCPTVQQWYFATKIVMTNCEKNIFQWDVRNKLENMIYIEHTYNQEFRREGRTETAIIPCKLNKSL